MKQKTAVSLLSALMLIGGLTACSGGSNQSAPAASANTTTTPPVDPQKERDEVEYALDPNKSVKWRQLTNFPGSSQTEVADPLKQNGNISPVKGAAAYINGMMYYGSDAVNFRNATHRSKLVYDPEFMTKGDIDPTKVQTHAIKDASGKTVANFYYVNQKNASYLSWKSEELPVLAGEPIKSAAVGYVAVPTAADKAILDKKVKATYKGHTLTPKTGETNEFHLANLQLDADFEKMEISGKITNRNDTLLDSRAKYDGKWDVEYTTIPEDLEDDEELKLISAEEMEERIRKHRVMDIVLLPTNINVKNGVVSFEHKDAALQYTSLNGKDVKVGYYGGIFAGKDAEEVVGEIKVSDNHSSFGATESGAGK